MNSGPALPWASPTQYAGCGRHGAILKINDRIEIRWEVEEEGAAPCTKWWGATVLEASKDESNSLRIRYDPSHGFDAEETEVQILSPDYLRHVDGTDELKWKREGAACIESDTEDQPVDGVMSLKDLTDEQEELERLTGRTVEEAAMQELASNLQPAQQTEVLSRFGDFVEHFKGHLQQLVQDNQEHVITAEEVQTIAQGFGRR